MLKQLLFLLIVQNLLFGYSTWDGGALLPPEPTFVQAVTSNINPVSGEYHEEEVDLVVAGCEPISLRRFYHHLGSKHPAYGHWTLNPEAMLLFNFYRNSDNSFAGLGDRRGGFTVLKKRVDDHFFFNIATQPSFTNPSQSGQHHPMNAHCSIRKFVPGKTEKSWRGLFVDGSGRQCSFATERGIWGKVDCDGYVYQVLALQERRPNGNVIKYDFEDYNRNQKRQKELQTFYLLKKISAYSATGTFLGAVDLNYSDHNVGPKGKKKRCVKYIYAKGSDKRYATYTNEVREVQGERKWRDPTFDVVLRGVQGSGKSAQTYNYRWSKGSLYSDSEEKGDNPYLFSALRPGHVHVTTSYEQKSGKIRSQAAPIGPSGKVLPIARYTYLSDHTVIYDAESQKKTVWFDQNERIVAEKHYDGDQLVSVERQEWDPANGNLIAKSIEDGEGNLLRRQEYTYDQCHNPIIETIGDGKESYSIYRTFSDDGFNLLLTESDRPGKEVHYAYLTNTNLPVSMLTYVNGQIVARTFYFYDAQLNSVCIKTITDDGSSKEWSDMAGITYRKITYVKPKRELPCIGLAEEVEERTLGDFGEEVLLNKVHYTYHPSGKVLKETHFDADGKLCYTLHNEYDKEEQLIATTDPLGQKTTYTYDERGNCIAQKGLHNVHREWKYDAVNRQTEEIEWLDGIPLTTHKTYDLCSRLIAQQDPCGFETRYTYNGVGQMTAIYHPDGGVELKAYDALGNVTQHTDQNGHVTTTTYNFLSKPTHIHYPDGSEESFSYHPHGTLASHTDRNGAITHYTYDLFDRVICTEVYSPHKERLKVATAAYAFFHKIAETDFNGETTYYSYDFAGRCINACIGERITVYAYDALGNRAHVYCGDTETIFQYDVKGQMLEKSIESQGRTLFRENYTYDPLGNLHQTTTAHGTSTTHYNALSLPIKQIDPSNQLTQIHYRYDRGFCVTTIDPHLVQTIEMHDCCGRLSHCHVRNAAGELIQHYEHHFDPCGNQVRAIQHIFRGTEQEREVITEWEYGPMHQLLKRVEAGEKVTTFTYDQAGRLYQTHKPDHTRLECEYDCLGRLSHYSGPDFDYRYTYDANDQILSVQEPAAKTTRRYDLYGNMIQEELANGLILSSTYFPTCEKRTLMFPDGLHATYTYQGPYFKTLFYGEHTYSIAERSLAGLPTKIKLPRKKNIDITYDKQARWKAFKAPNFSATYTYDPLSRLTHYRYSDPIGSEDISYTYDDLHQLTAENTTHYAYDSLYNRTHKDDQSYTLNTLSQITSAGGMHYQYDPCGNLISDGTTSYTYDSLDRLIATTKEGVRTTYTYDPFNRRIAKDDHLYLWDGNDEVGLYHNNTITQRRILVGSTPALLELNDAIYIPIIDHRGSLTLLLDSRGKPAETYRYTAYGEQLTDASLSPWRFASKRHDNETGFTYFGRRYYHPTLGRFITPDPLGFEDGPNLYAYVHNCPLTFIDYHGYFSLSAFFHLSGYDDYLANKFVPFTPDHVIPIGDPPTSGDCVVFGNGINCQERGCIETTGEILDAFGADGGYLLYNGTRGLIGDAFETLLGKCGLISPYEKMCADFYTAQLDENPNLTFTTVSHSQNGMHHSNISTLLEPEYTKNITLLTFGSATIVDDQAFGHVRNFISESDPVPMLSAGYGEARKGNIANTEFLPASSKNPIKEHLTHGPTYWPQINRLGDRYKARHAR